MTTTNISERAVLVHLSISMWSGNQNDKTSERRIASEHNAADDAVRVTIKLLPRQLIQNCQRASTILRQAHYALSLPWLTGGVRILPSGFLDRYNEAVREGTETFSRAADEFCNFYDTYRQSASARERLGTLAATLPTTDEVRSQFSIQSDVLPMPSVNDFRLELGGNTIAMRKKMEDSINAMTASAVKSLWGKMNEMVERIYTQTSKKKGKIFDSSLANLREFCDNLATLNITNDPQIEAMRQTCISQLASFKTDDIRSEQDTRKTVAKNAKDILDSIRKIDLDIE